jgi:putative oxygen-independent coproporphyrinogen III oxidase
LGCLAGVYIHIPFCKQACTYCNFHFTTSLRRKNELVAALLSEIHLRKHYLGKESIETIYFGGGTPSLLDIHDLELLLKKVFSTFTLRSDVEITIETNPDDITEAKLKQWKAAGVNRLSVGVQSFFEEDLRWMNRAHTAYEGLRSLELAIKYFDNITIDLIYGMPLLTSEKWKTNVDRSIALGVPHLSCYALTVEPKTPLDKMIRTHEVPNVNPDHQSEQFLLLMQWMNGEGYEHYEISNFAKPGFRSRHNSAYWQGKKYIGIGPSAHSFDTISRQWNVSNNHIYIDSIKNGVMPFEKEILTPVQKLNEYIMTSLRTIEGLDLNRVMDATLIHEIEIASRKFIERGLIVEDNKHLRLTQNGKLLADGIAAELFFEKKISQIVN